MGRPKGGTNRRWKRDEKVQLIREYYQSEIGYKAFAKEHGISPSLFNTWVKKYNEGGAENLGHKRRKVPDLESMNKDRELEILYLKMIIAEQQIQIEKLKSKFGEV